MKPAPFAYARPHSRADVDELLAGGSGAAKILAGGQSLVPLLNMRLATVDMIIDINTLPDEPGAPDLTGGRVRFGPLVRHAAVEASPEVARSLPVLAEAMRHVGHPPVRSRGTLAGAIAHADPASELPAVFALLEGDVRARSLRGTRRIGAAELFLGPLETALEPDEWIDEVAIAPVPDGCGTAVEEFGRRSADYAICGVAAFARDLGAAVQVSLSYFSMGDVPSVIRLPACEPDEVASQVRAAVDERLDPPDDVHGSAEYRRHLGHRLGVRASARAIAAARQSATGGPQ